MRQRMKAATARHQLRHGRSVAGARARPAPADRQRDHRAAQADLSALLGMARQHGAGAPCSNAASRAILPAGRCTSPRSPNKRTLYNFPMQAGGAEMLRLGGVAAVRGRHRADACWFTTASCSRRQIARRSSTPRRSCARPAATSAAASRSASTSIRSSDGGARYRDKRPVAQKMWATIMGTLEAIGALPRRASA